MIITRTPLRVSFAGGGTDFPDFYRQHGGKVVSCAIDKYIYVIVKERWDDKIYVNYSRKEVVDHVDELQHDLVRESMKLCGVLSGVEITTLADIPSEGSGLGSSSAVTVGLINALHSFKGRQMPNDKLAEQACEIELGILKRPMGVQDAWPCAMGGLRAYEFGPGDVTNNFPIDLENSESEGLQRSLTLFYSGITRRSESILQEQKSNIADAEKNLILLRDLAHGLHTEIGAEAIQSIANALNKGWSYKKKFASNVSNDKLDKLVEGCLSAGADGVKVCGAGGGGFLLVLASPRDLPDVRAAMGDRWEIPVCISSYGSQVVFSM